MIMFWIGILFLIAFIAAFIVCFVIDDMHRLDYYLIGVFSGVIIMTTTGIFISYFASPITPMDVYQGKTTLKYEVVDGVKVDSIVVWKKE